MIEKETLGYRNGITLVKEHNSDSNLYEPREEASSCWKLIGKSPNFDEYATNWYDFIYDYGLKEHLDARLLDTDPKAYIKLLQAKGLELGIYIEPIEHSIEDGHEYQRGNQFQLLGVGIMLEKDAKLHAKSDVITNTDLQHLKELLDRDLAILADWERERTYDLVGYNDNGEVVDVRGIFYESQLKSLTKDKIQNFIKYNFE